MDDKVDIEDLAIVAASFNTRWRGPGYGLAADLTRGGLIDVFDLVFVGMN